MILLELTLKSSAPAACFGQQLLSDHSRLLHYARISSAVIACTYFEKLICCARKCRTLLTITQYIPLAR